MKAKAIVYFVFIFSLGFTACTRPAPSAPAAVKAATPEDVVRSFVDLSASVKEPGDKQKLQALCSGEMRRAFDRMPDEEFKIAYGGELKISDVKILESKVDGDLAKIRYSVAVDNNQGTDHTKEENEREVELVKVQDIWLLQTIRTKGVDKIAFTKGMIF